MGAYLNPGNTGFARILRGIYVDKTAMLSLINRSIDTPENLICVSRPRRFGKSYAAQMLSAYYDKTCDSSALFAPLAISSDETYPVYLNRYDVLYLDMTNVMGSAEGQDFISFISRGITREIAEAYPQAAPGDSLSTTLLNAALHIGSRFIMIIDEWDAPLREMPEREQDYLHFLRTLFKSSGTTSRTFAAVYMTGILPIRKDGSQSAVSDFMEYTMLNPGPFVPYVGFSQEEVHALCDAQHVDFQQMKRWYDGYAFRNMPSVYNPNSVMKAIAYNHFDSYWSRTSAADSLLSYINQDFSGLQKTVTELIAGLREPVNTVRFVNDFRIFNSADDVLTLLIHLGYLAYDWEDHTVRIPNEEIRREFALAIRQADHPETRRRVAECDQLLQNIINLNADAVAAQIEKIHAEETAPLHYNSEQGLRSVIKLAFFTYKDHYLQWEEVPAGVGYADIVYLPKPTSGYPALVIELKWNQSAEGAIDQIKRRQYPKALEGYGGEVILVGVSYDKNQKPGERKHHCVIEQVEI